LSTIADELEKFASMLERGLITREQFEAQRDKLLAGDAAPVSGPAPAPAQGSDPAMRSSVGAYQLISMIGEGGMGAVYRGRHRSETLAERQGGDVAIKVMHPQYARNTEYRARFEREASLGLKLDHPGIVKVHDLVVDGGELALVMDHVDGWPMTDAIGEVVGPIPWPKAWALFEKLLDAVSYAHDQGVVHRDLKPDNVLLTPDGSPRVIDFGIAKDLDASGTRTGTGMGTVEYMAPEQYADAKAVDARADIYSLGMILYEMLAGRLPWDATATQFQILEQKARKQLMSPSAFCREIPPEIVATLSPALSADPAERPASARAFASSLKAVMSARPMGTGGASSPPAADAEKPSGVASNDAGGTASDPTGYPTAPAWDPNDPLVRDRLMGLARDMSDVASLPCPLCNAQVAPLRLLSHFDAAHGQHGRAQVETGSADPQRGVAGYFGADVAANAPGEFVSRSMDRGRERSTPAPAPPLTAPVYSELDLARRNRIRSLLFAVLAAGLFLLSGFVGHTWTLVASIVAALLLPSSRSVVIASAVVTAGYGLLLALLNWQPTQATHLLFWTIGQAGIALWVFFYLRGAGEILRPRPGTRRWNAVRLTAVLGTVALFISPLSPFYGFYFPVLLVSLLLACFVVAFDRARPLFWVVVCGFGLFMARDIGEQTLIPLFHGYRSEFFFPGDYLAWWIRPAAFLIVLLVAWAARRIRPAPTRT